MPSQLLAAFLRQRALSALALGTLLISFFLLLGHAPLFDVDEGAFSQATLEMFQRGDFLSTYLNGQPRYDKPILIYWLQAVSVATFGVNEFAFRFPSALCATFWVVLTFLFVRRCFDLRCALLAAIILAGSLGVYIIGRSATADALLNSLIAASMFSAWLHLETGKRVWLYATFAAIGLGFLAKGPVALLIPLAVTFVFCLLRRDLKTWARAVFDWRGLLLFAAIALNASNAVPSATLSWKSNLDGELGTGPAITTTLTGGSCAHRLIRSLSQLARECRRPRWLPSHRHD